MIRPPFAPWGQALCRPQDLSSLVHTIGSALDSSICVHSLAISSNVLRCCSLAASSAPAKALLCLAPAFVQLQVVASLVSCLSPNYAAMLGFQRWERPASIGGTEWT